VLPDDDLASDMLDLITERTAAAGLAALRGLGLRAARPPLPAQPELLAVRRLPGHRRRRARQAELSAPRAAPGALARAGGYMEQALAGQAVSNEDEVARAQLPFEFMLNALRLREGFALADFSERTGLPLSAIAQPGLAEAEQRGLLARETAPARAGRPTRAASTS
jgi:hypothetical protein